MPFTLSHAALVLPATSLPKKVYSLTGLITGSFVPDFEYFIRMKGYSIYSHTWLGVLWFDLPLGILLAFLYHYVVRDMFLENLPKSIYQRCVIFKQLNWWKYFKVNWLVVCISIVVGAASHLLWDSFTHGNGYFVKIFPSLKENVVIIGISRPFYNLLQHASTLIGGVVIAYAIYKLPRDIQSNQSANINYWFTTIIVSIIVLAIRIWIGFDYRSLDQTAINVVSCGIIGLIISPMLLPKKANE